MRVGRKVLSKKFRYNKNVWKEVKVVSNRKSFKRAKVEDEVCERYNQYFEGL